MIALLLMQKILAMFLMMLVGFVLVRLKTFRPEESLVLSRIVVLLVMPCVAIKAFQIDYTESVRNGLLLALLASLIVFGIGPGAASQSTGCPAGSPPSPCTGSTGAAHGFHSQSHCSHGQGRRSHSAETAAQKPRSASFAVFFADDLAHGHRRCAAASCFSRPHC